MVGTVDLPYRAECNAMDLSAHTDEAQLVCTIAEGPEVLGYVVIHSTVSGRACGGLRMAPNIDEAEVRGLALGMTLKFGFLRLPQGGAKAAVVGDPDAPVLQRRRQLARFGRAIAPLLRQGIYVPAADMGTDLADIRYVLRTAGVRLKRRELRVERTGYYTAVTVFAAATQAAQHLGFALPGATAAIEGFGKVGGSLAELLAGAGVRVVAVSTSHGAIHNPQGLDVVHLRRLARDAGSRLVELYQDAERIDLGALLELPVDFLCPCARTRSLHGGNAARVTARVIVPGANDPITPEAEHELFVRGILCVPDFVANSGGVLGGTMAFAAIDQATITALMERQVGERVKWLLAEAARQQISPRDLAIPWAWRRFEEVREQAAHRTPRGQLFAAGLDAYRRGWVPGRLVARLAVPYFERRLR
jgi:glutamate dehydrogenase (NAD(P)+)